MCLEPERSVRNVLISACRVYHWRIISLLTDKSLFTVSCVLLPLPFYILMIMWSPISSMCYSVGPIFTKMNCLVIMIYIKQAVTTEPGTSNVTLHGFNGASTDWFFPKSIHMRFYFVLLSTAGWHILLRYTLIDCDVPILASYSMTSNVLMIQGAWISSCVIVTQLEYTTECRYTAFQFIRILHTRWQQQNVNQTSNSRESYGVSVLRVFKKIDHVLTAPHCTVPIGMVRIGMYKEKHLYNSHLCGLVNTCVNTCYQIAI